MGSASVDDGVVYVGSYDHKIYAFNASNGALIWNATTGGVVISRPAVVGGIVYVGSEDHNLYAFNATNGNKLWNYTTGYYVDSDPAVANGIVYFGSEDKKVYALNATTGEYLWSYVTGDKIMISSVTVSEGISLHRLIRPQDLRFKCYRRRTYLELYNRRPNSFFPTIVKGVVYVGSVR